MKNIQENVLKSITKAFLEGSIPAVFRTKEAEPNLISDTVSIIYPEYGNGDGEISASLFFAPTKEESDAQYFVTLLHIAYDIDNAVKQDIINALHMINFMLPFGAFVMAPDGSELCFKMVTPMSSYMTEEKLETEINIQVAGALDVAEEYTGILQKMAAGKATLADLRF